MEYQFLRRSSSGQRGNLVLQLFPAHQVMVSLIHLHGISQGSRCTGHDSDLLHRRRIGLLRRHERMSDLVIGNNLLLLVRKDRILFLIAGDHDLDAFLKICLCHVAPVFPYRPQRRLIDDVGKLCAGCAGRHPGDHREVHVLGKLYFLRVDLQYLLAAFQIRQLHRNSPVKPSRSRKRRIQ